MSAVADPEALTPVERIGDLYAKREDLFRFGGASGGKVRAALLLARAGPVPPAGLVCSASRLSPQPLRVAAVARALGLPCRAHVGAGALSEEVLAAREAGAEIVQHRPGYASVVRARARADAADRGWLEIPWGGVSPVAVVSARRQAANVPEEVRRVVVVAGSGATLAGVLRGLADWRERAEIVPSGSPYERPEQGAIGPIALDPHYEAKAVRLLRPGDLLWIVGTRSAGAA